VAWPAAAVAATSLSATSHTLLSGRGFSEAGRLIGLIEVASLLLLLALVVRWSRPVTVLLTGGAAAAAATFWILRFLPSYEPLAIIGGCASMAVAPAFAIVVGGLPRVAAEKLNRSVRTARQAQRLEIAHDLHDYVAHDVSGIVAQAQAVRFVHGQDAERLADALERIERTGLQALSAMDEMVALLAEDADGRQIPRLARLVELPDVIDRFRSERLPSCQVELSQDDRVLDPTVIPRQVQATAHRVVVEALTNVRRHAPAASWVAVDIHICDTEDRLVARVANDLRGAPPPSRLRASGGSGLIGLRERVQALGGGLTAGPHRDVEWVVEARIPIHRTPSL
jgi:signal transduction histidine kinase